MVLLRQYHSSRPKSDRVALGGPLRAALFFAIWFGGALLGFLFGSASGGFAAGPLGAMVGGAISFIVAVWAHRIPRIAAQWERAVVLRLGKYYGLKGPGVLLVFPIMRPVLFIDTPLLCPHTPP